MAHGLTAQELYLETQKLVASDAEANDWLGGAVVIQADVLVTSAQQTGGSPPDEPGALYVFERAAGTLGPWSEAAKLTASDAAVGDDLGICLALSGSRTAAGAAPFFSGDPELNQGAIYIFERDSLGDWGETAKIRPEELDPIDLFGCGLQLEGDTLAAGALGDDDLGLDAGAVYVYRWSGVAEAWEHVKKLAPLDGQADDFFGGAVVLNGSTIVATALGRAVGGLDQAGVVYVFERDAGGPDNWGEVARIEPPIPQMFGYFGEGLALEGDTLLIASSGGVYVFERESGNPNVWNLVGELAFQDPNKEPFGSSRLVLQGEVAVLGALSQDVGEVDAGGTAFVFSSASGAWKEVAQLTASDVSESMYFGWSVALDGPLIVVGAVNAETPVENGGAVYVFEDLSVFADGFESGDTSAWSMTVP